MATIACLAATLSNKKPAAKNSQNAFHSGCPPERKPLAVSFSSARSASGVLYGCSMPWSSLQTGTLAHPAPLAFFSGRQTVRCTSRCFQRSAERL